MTAIDYGLGVKWFGSVGADQTHFVLPMKSEIFSEASAGQDTLVRAGLRAVGFSDKSARGDWPTCQAFLSSRWYGRHLLQLAAHLKR